LAVGKKQLAKEEGERRKEKGIRINKSKIYFIFASQQLQNCRTVKLQNIICPDGRAERKEIARWAILERSQTAGVATSAILRKCRVL